MLATEQFVRAVEKTEKFRPTRSFHPLTHAEALDAVELAMNKVNLHIDHSETGNARKRFTLSGIKDRLNGQMAASLPLMNPIDSETGMKVVILNSWDKTRPLKVGFGAEVFVCCNGSVFAEQVIGRKHTTNILNDLPHLLNEVISKVNMYAEHQRRFFQRLREITLTDEQANDFILRSVVDHECVKPAEIPHVVEQWRFPAFDDFKPRTAWSLHNAFTEVGKKIQISNGMVHSERSVRMSGLFADEFASDLCLPASRVA
ncbi:MAG: DUF932 domain-containing protein [Nitrosopumilus sp.]